MEPKTYCHGCVYFDPFDQDCTTDGIRYDPHPGYKGGEILMGLCHRFPPFCRLLTNDPEQLHGDDWRQPVVCALDWCGEFRAGSNWQPGAAENQNQR